MKYLTAAIGTGACALIALLLAVTSILIPNDGPTQSCAAPTDIPPDYLTHYQRAATRYGLPWPLLAAVGKIETDHGRAPGPGVTSATNHAGAAGPMQFMPTTWQTYATDGNNDGTTDIYDPADAITTAAHYLHRSGAPHRTEQALHTYNHSQTYVRTVLHTATTYAATPNPGCSLTIPPPGPGAVAVTAALHWLGTPYSWGGGGLTGPTLGIDHGSSTVGFDCSGLTRYAWHQTGITLPRIAADQWHAFPHVPPGQETPGDLVFFRSSTGTPTNPGHVGLILDTQHMIEAPRTGLTIRITPWTTRHDLIGVARPIPQDQP